MGQFVVILTKKAIADIAKHKKTGNKQSEKKIKTFLEELKHELQGYWSRRINQKDRMIYSVNENIVVLKLFPQ